MWLEQHEEGNQGGSGDRQVLARSLPEGALLRYVRASCRHAIKFNVHLKLLSA